jgi:hypothetical protein
MQSKSSPREELHVDRRMAADAGRLGFWRPGEKKVLSVNIIARLVHGLFWRVSSPKRRITKSKKPSRISRRRFRMPTNMSTKIPKQKFGKLWAAASSPSSPSLKSKLATLERWRGRAGSGHCCSWQHLLLHPCAPTGIYPWGEGQPPLGAVAWRSSATAASGNALGSGKPL